VVQSPGGGGGGRRRLASNYCTVKLCAVGSGLWAIPDTSDTRWQALRGPVCVGVGLVQRQGVPSIASTTSVGLVVVATGSALVDSAWQSAVGSVGLSSSEKQLVLEGLPR
jgi:hypothetical protein